MAQSGRPSAWSSAILRSSAAIVTAARRYHGAPCSMTNIGMEFKYDHLQCFPAEHTMAYHAEP